MNPHESPATFKFLEAVFDGEKKALEDKMFALSHPDSNSDEESIDIPKTTDRLQRRLALVSKYWEDNKSSHSLIFMQNGKYEIICPRCLVHAGRPQKMTILAEIIPGEKQLLCKQCGLQHNMDRYSPIPNPTAPL